MEKVEKSALPASYDREAVFNDDYLYFFSARLDEAQSDADARLIASLTGLKEGSRVLDLGCGTGRIARRLAGMGAVVTGLDATARYLEIAAQADRKCGEKVRYVEGDMRNLAFDSEFDVVVSWFTSFGYFDDESNRAVLDGIATALAPGGRLVMDLHNRDELMGRWRESACVERNGDILVDRRRFDPLTSRLYVERIVVRENQVRRTSFFTRLFTFTELRQWLLDARFREVDAFGPAGEPLSHSSARMVVLAAR